MTPTAGLLVVLLVYCLRFCNATPTIYTISPTAYPGEIFQVAGDAFGAQPQLWVSSNNNNNGNPSQLPLITQIPNSVTAVIPPSWIMDVYTVYISDGSSKSSTRNINQAQGGWYDMISVLSGSPFKIYGKNLYFPGSGLTPTVSFVPTNSSYPTANLAAQVLTSQSDPFILTAVAPSGVVDNGVYTVTIDNGYSHPSQVVDTIIARKGPDPFGIAMGLGADFGHANFTGYVIDLYPNTTGNPNSIADDNRILTAIFLAGRNGGGIIRLHAGHFYLRNIGIQLGNNFILQGDGMDVTFLHFGSAFTTNSNLFYSFGIDLWGFIDLTFQGDQPVPLTFHDMHGCSRGLFLRVNFNIGYIYNSYNFGCGNSLVQDCKLKAKVNSTAGYIAGSIGGPCSTGLYFKRFDFYYEAGAMGFDSSTYVTLDEFNVIRNQTLQRLYGINNFRGITFNFGNKVVVTNSRLETINYDALTALQTNDGETILSEGGGPKPGWAVVGNVTSATSTTLTDLRQNFTGVVISYWNPYHIAIINGPGAGQIRKVISGKDHVATLEWAWDVIPTAQSEYVMNAMTVNWLIKNTTFIGWNKGAPELYLGRAANVTVVDNTYINNGGPYIQPNVRSGVNPCINFCETGDGPYCYIQNSTWYGVGYNIQFLNNYLYVNESTQYLQLGVFGGGNFINSVAVTGIEIRNNVLIREGNATYPTQDGLGLTFCSTSMFLQSPVVQNNTINTPMQLSPSIYGTVIACTNTQKLPGGNVSQALGCGLPTNSTITSEYCPTWNFAWMPPHKSNAVELMPTSIILFILIMIM